jgi:hypothetical protein
VDQSRPRLSAIASAFFMRAHKDAVEMRAPTCKFGRHAFVDVLNILCMHKAPSNAPLIGDHNNEETGRVE